MIFAYEIRDHHSIIRRCYGYGGRVELPEEIDGAPVTELGAYAFSAHMDIRELKQGLLNGSIFLWDADLERPVRSGDLKACGEAVVGSSLEEVSLPETLTKIGAYAFYQCSTLSHLRFYGNLTDLGAGLFTGAHAMRTLTVILPESCTSCLGEMLQELSEKLTVDMEGALRARLVFPAFYEESVENTPARIFMTQMHGSGMNFRNCVYAKKLDFQAYDECYYRAKMEEELDTVLEMTLGRLLFPAELIPKHRGVYEAWLRENMGEALKAVVLERDRETLAYLLKQGATIPQLKQAASVAAGEDWPEGAALLMDSLRGQGGELTMAGSLPPGASYSSGRPGMGYVLAEIVMGFSADDAAASGGKRDMWGSSGDLSGGFPDQDAEGGFGRICVRAR